MSYLTVSVIAADQNMRQRVAACAATQGVDNPENWAYTHSFLWAASPGWDTKWESALAGGIEAPGADEAVITDADLLAQVQKMLQPPTEGL